VLALAAVEEAAMNLTPDLLRRRTQQFVLWRPARVNASPRLIIGKYVGSDPPGLEDQREVDLSRDPRFEDVWTLDPADCGLANGVYHYWFEVDSSNPYEPARRVMRPIRPHRTVDWRLLAPASVSPNDASVPAGVILVRDGSLMTCDPGGGEPAWSNDGELAEMPANNRTVIYELPTQWTRAADEHGVEVAAGTFEDVLALVEPASASPNFAHIQALSAGQAHLLTLGVTTLELLPIADSVISLGWKYGTTNYFAPDHTLGLPDGKQVPEPNGDLARLVSTCHSAGIRFFLDAVMGFARQEPYAQINFSDFHVRWLDGRDPNRDPEQDDRNAWGGDLWKYNYSTFGYDPIEGSATTMYPGRQLMQAFIARWILDQRIDGIRIDSVDTIYNWDFVGELRKYARDLFRARAAGLGVNAGDADARFLIVGETCRCRAASCAHGLTQCGTTSSSTRCAPRRWERSARATPTSRLRSARS